MNFLNNVKWVSISQFVKVICQLFGLVVFARYLTPQDIGVMSLTLVVVNFVNIFRDMGSSAAIIQKDEMDGEIKSSVFIMNMVLGFALAIVFYTSSHHMAVFFGHDKLEYTIKLITLSFIFNSFTSVHLAILERDSKFKKIAFIESVSSISSLAIGIFFAANNYGVYSLVSQTLSFSILTAISFYISSGWKPCISFNFDNIKSIYKFSSNLVFFNFINYFSRNSDQLIIGKFFTTSILGEYSLAYKVMLFPLQNITSVLTRSLYPILSRLQSSPRDSFITYLKTIKAISLIVPAMMLGLSAVSNEFVALLFGNQWNILPQLLTWLSIVGILQAMVSSTGSVFMSRGRTDLLLYISIFNAALQVGSFIIGAFYNIEILVRLYLLANSIMFFPNMFMAIRILNGSVIELIKCIYKPFICAIVMFFMIKLVGWALSTFNLSLSSLFIAKVSTGLTVYIALIITTDPFLFNILRVNFLSKIICFKTK